MLTIPATTSCVVAVLALFMGVAAIAVSAGPGLGALRWFGIATLFASLYAVCALITTLDIDPSYRPFFGRLGSSAAILLLGSWLAYFAADEGGSLRRWHRRFVTGVAIVGVSWLVPGVFRSSTLFVRHVAWLGVTYTTTRPTALGKDVFTALMALTIVVAATIAYRAWRAKRRGALGNLLGILTQLATGINDALAASGKIDTPYLLDVGQFLVVITVGSSVIARVVDNARALERSAADLRAAQEELLRRERLAALGEMSAVVAHEVRNPLTVIFNAVTSLRKQKVFTNDTTTLLDILREEAERLRRVVGELLEFARPRDLVLVTVQPKPLVEGAVEAALAVFDGEEQIDVDIAPDLPDLEGDEQLLRQALINLITNALQANERDGRVHVSVVAERGSPATVEFRVTDDGRGIRADIAPRMFTPFFTTRATGTGLGLAIVKRVAEAHGGDIAWRAGNGRGTTFTLRVPTQRTP